MADTLDQPRAPDMDSVRSADSVMPGGNDNCAPSVGLGEALQNGWIEFWHQPKIDLRKKQLIGAEALARVRHPQLGVLPPAAFILGASAAELLALSQLALANALEAGLNFAKLGINLRFAVNIPIAALVELPIADVVRAHHGEAEQWPGLIVDINEEQIFTDLALHVAMA